MSNIILERRNDILTNHNTAQKEFETILETLTRNPNIDRIEINRPLHGNINFSVLSVFGFNQIKTIIFAVKGEITSVSGFPKNLEVLKINDQYLVELNDLPKSLRELECAHNYITNIDLTNNTSLDILNVSYNKLESLEPPENLKKLYCNNNNISKLVLKNNTVLEVLHCSNNKTIIIEGLPPSVIDFQCENNPYIKNEYSDIHGGSPVNGGAKETDIDYYEALQKYMKLKSEYETEFKYARKNAYEVAKLMGLRKKGRAARVAAVLPKCVSCKRPVGSIFTIKNNNYIATCGDAQSPCPLNIKLYRGTCWDTNNYILYVKDSIEDIKELVIYTKLSSIFKYKSERTSLNKFNELMEEYNDFHGFYMGIKNTYDKQIKDPVREQLIKRKMEQVYKLIDAIKSLVMQYKKEGNPNILQTAVQMQVDELNPEIENLRRLKYEVMEMDENILTQRYSTIKNMTYCSEDAGPKVIEWRTILVEEEDSTDATDSYDPTCPSAKKEPQDCMSRGDYLRQAKIFHPDRNPGCSSTATEKFQVLERICKNNNGGEK